MPTKSEILNYFLKRGNERQAVSDKELIHEFNLSSSAAFHWLARLRDQALIEFKYNSDSGKCYMLTEKGKRRLEFLKKDESPSEKRDVWDVFFDGLFEDD